MTFFNRYPCIEIDYLEQIANKYNCEIHWVWEYNNEGESVIELATRIEFSPQSIAKHMQDADRNTCRYEQ